MKLLYAAVICWAALMTGLGIYLAISSWNPEKSIRVVTVDLVELTSDFTLDLAAGNLSDEEVKTQSRAWAERLQAQLRAVARDNNLIIIPKGVGVYGAEDITAMIRGANGGDREVPE